MAQSAASAWKEETESWNWLVVTGWALRRSFERPFHGFRETIDYDQVGSHRAGRLGPAEFPVLEGPHAEAVAFREFRLGEA